jgi:hypothetical protein
MQALSNLGYFGITLGGIALFGAGFMITVAAALYMLAGDSGWPDNGWTIAFITGAAAAALSLIVITIIATVQQLSGGTNRSFSAWIEETAGMALMQNFAGFFIVMRLFD